MHRSILLQIALTGVLAASIARGQDDLFSELEVDSVYRSAATSGSSGDSATPATPSEIAGPASLGEALRGAGFAPKEVDSRHLSVEVLDGAVKRTAFLTVSDDRRRVHLVLPLDALAKGQSLSMDRLTSLMDANRADRSSHFAFSAKLGRVELHRSLENDGVTGERLKEALASMVAVAAETAGLWKIDAAEAKSAPAAKPTSTATAATPSSPSTPASLVGSWSATRSRTQAFALRLGADGTFALVTVDGTKTATSSGSYDLGSDRLTLKDAKSGNLAGAVRIRGADEFEFVPDGAAAASKLTFKRAK